MQTFEQKALMLIGFSVLWAFVLVIVSRDIGWYAAIGFLMPFLCFAAILGIPLYREWKIIAKGECFEGTLIARGQEYVFQKYYSIEAEFFMDEQRHTTAFPLGTIVYDSLTSVRCTVYCLEICGKKRCIVRDIQYDKSYCSSGIPLPEKPESELCGRWYLAFSDKELAEQAEKQRTHAASADYRNLYQ